MITFESLSDLLSALDEYIEYHNLFIAKYGDRLGGLLRGGTEDVTPSREDEHGWYLLESEEFTIKVANSISLPAAESSQLFKIVDALKARVASLEAARVLLGELPSQGFRPDQRYIVMFKDGLPKQVIPTNESYQQQRKFRYSEHFELNVLT